MSYTDTLQKLEDSKYLISMVSVDEIIRFGHSIGLNEHSDVLDLCCGYGTVLKIWHEAFGISGTGVDICNEFVSKGQTRLKESGIDKIKLIYADVLQYNDSVKYDVVICSETFDNIPFTLSIGENFLIPHGVLVYQKVYSKIPNPPQKLIDFDGEVLPLCELNCEFNRLGYFITHMASDSVGDWERYITWSAKRDIDTLRNNPSDNLKEWIDKWYKMYFNYRRPYEGQALFGLEKL